MKTGPSLVLSLAFSLVSVGTAMADPAQRVLALGGSVTEIVAALGAEDRLVARDTRLDERASICLRQSARR